MESTASLSTTQQSSFSPPRRPMPSFYQRPLPSTCTAFSSPLGRNVFKSAMQQGGLKSFFALIEQHTTQTEPAYCGLATLIVALNAMAIDPRHNWKNPWRWYHEEILRCCCDFNLEEVKKNGITMADFRCLAVCQGLRVDMHYAEEETTSLESFRETIRQVCVDETTEEMESVPLDPTGASLSQVLVVSYDRKTMGQTGSGHFAPIAAYDSISDNVLILDTARFKYGSHWVSVEKLYEALMPIDKDSDRSRGYIVLTKDRERSVSNYEGTKPQFLLRPLEDPSAVEVRREFLLFWRETGSEIHWDDFHAFWTKHETDPGYVWYFCDPVIKPCQENDINVVQNALQQLRSRMEQHVGRCAPSSNGQIISTCRPNLNRSIPLLHTEAIYLIFLACIEPDSNHDLGFDDGPDGELLQGSVQVIRETLFSSKN